uniref:Uncharacterized protein n=1 Tax=Quercus lobata TaxID=97700 RepID=A0A7N2R8Q8_QUELO
MEAARFGHQRRLMIMNKKRMAKMYSTNIESSKKFGGGSHRSKKPDDISMTHDTDVVGLNGDVATMTNVQEAGRHLPTNVNALDEYLPTTELIVLTSLLFIVIIEFCNFGNRLFLVSGYYYV